jgi:hypothetical protein
MAAVPVGVRAMEAMEEAEQVALFVLFGQDQQDNFHQHV